MVSDRHLCVALGEPRPQSERQQELLCLQAAHSNCARYLRGVANPEAPATRSRIPRPTVLAAVVLLASIGFSFGFVLQRGGLELSGFQSLSQSAGASRPVPTTAAVTTASQAAFGPGVSISPPPGRHRDRDRRADRHTAAADTRPHRRPNAWPFAEPNAWPFAQPVAGADAERERGRDPRRDAGFHHRADTRAHAAAHGDAPTHERPVPVITRCPGRSDCWSYTVRTGDNLFSIAHWFGVSLDRIHAMNPWARTRGIHPGNDLLYSDADPLTAPRRRDPAIPRHPASTPDCWIPPEPARHAAHRATAGDVTSAVTRG